MIMKMEKGAFERLMEEKNANKEVTLGASLRAHVGTVYCQMVSEDGTDFVQGLCAIAVHRRGNGDQFGSKVLGIWIAPECRRIGFGKALLENAIDLANNFAKDNGSVMGLQNCQVGYSANNKAAAGLFNSANFEPKGRGMYVRKM